MNNENEKKEYEEPKVQKVEFDFNEVITASGCLFCEDVNPTYQGGYNPFL